MNVNGTHSCNRTTRIHSNYYICIPSLVYEYIFVFTVMLWYVLDLSKHTLTMLIALLFANPSMKLDTRGLCHPPPLHSLLPSPASTHRRSCLAQQ